MITFRKLRMAVAYLLTAISTVVGTMAARQGCEDSAKPRQSARPTPTPLLRRSRPPPSGPSPCTDIRSGLRHLPREPLSTPQQPPIIAARTA